MTKKEMLEELEENDWAEELTEDSSYEEIKERYQDYIHDTDNEEGALYPNGRDYDAESYD